MADRDVSQSPVIDILQRGNDLLIRTEADIRPEDVRVEVRDGVLEVRVPRSALRPSRQPRPAESPGRPDTEAGTPGAQARVRVEQPERPDRSHPSGTQGAEPPLGVPDERGLWAAQQPLISEDRRTSIHLEGFSDEQAEAVLEVMGDDAPEEAQGGSATGSDVFPEHGGFPSRSGEEEEQSS